MLETTTKWENLTIRWPWAQSLQTHWCLGIANVNLRDTALLSHRQPIRKSCTSRSHTLGCPSLTLPLKMLWWNPSGSSDFLEHESLVLLARPCNRPFSAPNSDVSCCLASLCVRHTNLCLVTASPGSLLEMLSPGPHPDLLTQTLHFNKTVCLHTETSAELPQESSTQQRQAPATEPLWLQSLQDEVLQREN